jgi:hypothetical protein
MASRFDNLTLLDAGGANLFSSHGTVFGFDADHVEVRQKPALGDTGRVQTDPAFVFGQTVPNDRIPRHRSLAANLTYSRHDRFSLTKRGLIIAFRNRSHKQKGDFRIDLFHVDYDFM